VAEYLSNLFVYHHYSCLASRSHDYRRLSCPSIEAWNFPNCLSTHILSAPQRRRTIHHLQFYCQSEPPPTSAPAWMDGALKGFSFLSLCHPRLTFFACPDQPWSQFFYPPWSLFSFWNFIFSPPPTRFPFLFACETFPSHPPTTPHCTPLTYSPITLKCATLLPTHLPALPPTYLPTL
jgi:hypothetical protein